MSRARLIVLPAITVLTTVLLAAPALYANHVEAGMRGRGERLVPDVAGGATTLALVAVLTPFVLLVLLLTVGRAALKARSRRFRIVYAVSTLVGQFALAVGLLALVVVTDPYFLGGHLVQRLPSPDAWRTAYLYSGGFICGFDVYVAEGEAWTMKRGESVTLDCTRDEGVHLEWTDARHVRLTRD